MVEKIDPDTKGSIKAHVRDFVNKYMEDQYLPVELRNMFYNTRKTDENSISNLKLYEYLDFKTYGKDYQYMFFTDKAWKITANEITEMSMRDIDKNVWEKDIKIKCGRVRKTKTPIFTVRYSDTWIDFCKTATPKEKANFPDIDKYEIDINDDSFIFFKYLINTSRLFWKKQTEGEQLTEQELKEQRLHLINKIYSIGYLAHRYKNPSRPWAVFAVDGRESEFGKSFGGSGKSICYGAIEHVNNQFYIGGRDPRKLNNDFLFDGVDEYTDNIIIDDANQYLDFGFFYPYITGKFNVNPKNNKPFTLGFDESPKFSFTSNFAIRNIDPSTERRILYTVFSDYYHKKDQDGYYQDTLDPEKEFGKVLFNDFTEEEKIDPPMENVTKRNLRSSIGEGVFAWCNSFFVSGDNLNDYILKEKAFETCINSNYFNSNSKKFFDIRKFKQDIKMYCQYMGWIFNPEEAVNDGQGRIIKSIEGKNQEMFYIQTSTDVNIKIEHFDSVDKNLSPINQTDDIPF